MNDIRMDPRLEAFCSPKSPEVFFSVVGASQIWKDDPFDVESFHAEAREAFHGILAKSAASLSPGRVLLILGESGAGKTHLLRYFRGYVHGRGLGYFGYIQPASGSNDNEGYALSCLIDSLNQPYNSSDEISGLMRLSNAVAETPVGMKRMVRLRDKGANRRANWLTALREWEDLNRNQQAKLIETAIREIVKEPRFQKVDINVLAAMLYLQVRDPMIKGIVVNYLRARPVSKVFQKRVPALDMSAHGAIPIKMIEEIGTLMWKTQNRPLVLCVDQLEDFTHFPSGREHLNRFLGSMVRIAAQVPSSIVVISCLDSAYEEFKDRLTVSTKTKCEQTPGPIKLGKLAQTEEQVQLLVGQRLKFLYEEADVEYDPAQPVFPIPEADLAGCVKVQARQILELCGKFHESAVRSGNVPGSLTVDARIVTASTESIEELDRKWHAFLANWKNDVTVSEESKIPLLSKGLEFCGAEIETKSPVTCEVEKDFIFCSGGLGAFYVGICNKAPQGGGLQKQIEKLAAHARSHHIVIVRDAEFPKNPNAKISLYIGELIKKGARRAIVEDTEWRALMAFGHFHAQYGKKNEFPEWQRNFHPLTGYAGIQKILGLDAIGFMRQPVFEEPGDDTGAEPAAPFDSETIEVVMDPAGAEEFDRSTTRIDGSLWIGEFLGGESEKATMDLEHLTRNAAFIGNEGSGKTTASMNIVEQLLLRGVPVLIVDGNGDLSSYAEPGAWLTPLQNKEQEERRKKLNDAVSVSVYTPGHPNGRPLTLSIAPDGSNLLPPYEREQIAEYAAAALADMMGLKTNRRDMACRMILKHAIYLLTEINDPERVELREIIALVGERDASLLNLVGRMDTKSFDRLFQALQTLSLNRGRLLEPLGARLGAELLFGLGDFMEPKKTRLSIISTQYLGDNLNIEFFITQLLLELGRWISRRPSDRLQAVVMFDEADPYLPAFRKRSTKAPMKNLLKRSCSGGLGIFLSIRNPRDFDHECKENIQNWFLGKIDDPAALDKLHPDLSRGNPEISRQLSEQNTGSFYLIESNAPRRIRSDLSSIPLKRLSRERILELSVMEHADRIRDARDIFSAKPYSPAGIDILKEVVEASPGNSEANELMAMNLSPKDYWKMFNPQPKVEKLRDNAMLNRAMYHKIKNEIAILKDIVYEIISDCREGESDVFKRFIDAIDHIVAGIAQRRNKTEGAVEEIPEAGYENILGVISKTAHDISDFVNNELAVVEADARELLSDLEEEARFHKELEDLLTQVKFTQDALNDLKAINEGIKIRYSRFQVKELFEKWEKNRKLRHATIMLNIENGDSVFNGDKNKIKGLLNELMENSVTHNADRKDLEITITSRDVVDPEVITGEGCPLKKRFLYIRCRDNGGGMQSDSKKTIFLPLKTTSHTSSGLGLFIIRRTLREMNGYILETGESGADFKMYIPYSNGE